MKSARDWVIQGFLSLLAHERLWPKARDEYASIKVPNGTTEIVRNGNHFLSLDRPRELQHLIVGFARN